MLHLGNVYFHRKQLKHGQEGVEIGSDAEIRWTGHLLQLSVDGIKQALTTKTTVSFFKNIIYKIDVAGLIYSVGKICVLISESAFTSVGTM